MNARVDALQKEVDSLSKTVAAADEYTTANPETYWKARWRVASVGAAGGNRVNTTAIKEKRLEGKGLKVWCKIFELKTTGLNAEAQREHFESGPQIDKNVFDTAVLKLQNKLSVTQEELTKAKEEVSGFENEQSEIEGEIANGDH